MQKVLIAGATGYLGRFVVQEFKKQGYRVRALARNASGLKSLSEYIDEIFTGEVTDTNSLSVKFKHDRQMRVQILRKGNDHD